MLTMMAALFDIDNCGGWWSMIAMMTTTTTMAAAHTHD
jgi:hypothetical protein